MRKSFCPLAGKCQSGILHCIRGRRLAAGAVDGCNMGWIFSPFVDLAQWSCGTLSYNEACPEKKVSQNIPVCIQEQCSHWSSRAHFLYPLTHPFSFCYSSTQWWELRCLVIGVGIKIHSANICFSLGSSIKIQNSLTPFPLVRKLICLLFGEFLPKAMSKSYSIWC